LLGPSLALLNDGVEQALPFFETPVPDAAASTQLAGEEARQVLEAVRQRLPQGDLNADQARVLLAEVATAAGVKKGMVMKTLRASLLGSLQGPDLVSTWTLLHRSGADHSRIAAGQ
jgi:glutamyl-tRNA synthetase